MLPASGQSEIGIQVEDRSQSEYLFKSFKKINSKATNQGMIFAKPKTAVTHSIMFPALQPKHYGLFCKIEEKIEIKSKVPVRFRLGSLDYVNRLEQKYTPEAVKFRPY